MKVTKEVISEAIIQRSTDNTTIFGSVFFTYLPESQI